MVETVYLLTTEEAGTQVYREANDAFKAGPKDARWVAVSEGRWVNLNLATPYASVGEYEVQ